jgi:electron transfer flavoprotein beta subunit
LDENPVLKPVVQIVGLNLPPERKSGKIIEGESVEEKAVALTKALSEEAKVI